MKTAFQNIQQVVEGLERSDYLASDRIATVIYLAMKMEKPILLEGPAGVGKTDLGKSAAVALGWPLIRLQCYEGLDEAKALYEWEYAKQLLYTQILRDKISQVIEGTTTLAQAIDRITSQDSVFYSERFLLPRPLLKAFTADSPNVLLIDEIDKSDAEFEAFLLEALSDFQVSIPEIGSIKAKHVPLVFLTSNNTRELSNALKRRCLHLYIDYPAPEMERRILALKAPDTQPGLAAQLVEFVQALRLLDLKKAPSISESLDWAKALTILGASALGDGAAKDSLNILLKYEGDIRKGEEALGKYLARKQAEAARSQPTLTTGDEDPGKKIIN